MAITSPGEEQEAHWWGAEVVLSAVHGHPSLVYAKRPSHITAVLEHARRWAHRPFLIQGDRVVTFEEHEALVRATAARLRAQGVGPGDRVALFAANSPEWVATFFAAIALRAIAVPCNGWWSAEEMAHACELVDPAAVVSDERRLERVPAGQRVIATSALAASPAEPVDPGVDGNEDDPAVILFTAGTTRFPKGAVLSHRALVANVQSLLYVSRKLPHQVTDDNPPSTALVGLPLFHIGAIQLILVPPMTGSQVVFLEGRFEPAAVLEQMEARRVTMFSGVPTMMERLVAHPGVGRRDMSALRTVVLGGSPVDDALLGRVRSVFPGTARGVGKTYGLTEAGGVVSTGVGRQITEHPGSSGQLVPVVEVRIQDAGADGNGRILVRSPAAMDCYWGVPGDPTVDVDGWVDTGDLGRVDDDRFLYITGRAKDVIIRGGENIAPAAVEAVLTGHSAVAEAAVVGLPDPDLGEIVGAAVVLSSPVTSDELAAYAAQRLSSFSVPARWWLRSEQLPTNDAGKVLKHVLAAGWPGQKTEDPREEL
jgi:long-chain acyl-CoA synthetase